MQLSKAVKKPKYVNYWFLLFPSQREVCSKPDKFQVCESSSEVLQVQGEGHWEINISGCE
jgi:hypothetical protein